MTAKTHALGGFTAALLLAKTGCLGPYWLSLAAVGALGGLLPDVDHPGSYVGRRVPLVSDAVNMAFGHRGATHSLLAAFLFYLAARPIAGRLLSGAEARLAALVLAAGYVSHLLLDMLNPQAVPLLWPLKVRFRFPIPPVFPTSGLGEILIVRNCLLAAAGYLALLLGLASWSAGEMPSLTLEHFNGPLGVGLARGLRRFGYDVWNVIFSIGRLFVH